MENKGKTQARKIVLLSDGTGNAASSVWRTNVWRLFQSLDLTSDLQVAKYDDGVGSSSFVPLAIVGGVFGFGLRRNVIDLYKFVCRNYQEDSATRKRSEIYAFGFSRGAFTIRVLTALILQQGLVKYTPAMSESELHARATAAYRAYRASGSKTIFRIEWLLWTIRDAIAALKSKMAGKKPYSKDDNRVVPTVAFLGLWDTVAAYGLPIDEMTRGVSRWLWPLELPNRVLSDRVVCARHALALDDERTTFHPVLWTEKNEKSAAPDKDGRRWIKDERLSQVWFVGMHSNVGGGYPDDALAHIPLFWIAKEAERCGLAFKQDPDAFKPMRAGCDKDGRIYDSRSGLGGYYRYGPRKIVDLCLAKSDDPREDVYIEVPKIHESALKRIASDRNAYAPIGLPGKYAMVTDDDAPGGCNEILLQNNPYEKTQEQINRRFMLQEQLWNYVWLRRVVYFATVMASLYLVLYPLARSIPRSAEFETPLRVVSDAIRILGAFLPGSMTLWINTYARDPVSFLIAAFVVIALIWLGTRLSGKITDSMRAVWRGKDYPAGFVPHGAIFALRTHWLYQRIIRSIKIYIAPFVFAMLFLYIGLTLFSHLLFNLQDSAGFVCRDSKKPNGEPLDIRSDGLAKNEEKSKSFDVGSICNPTGIMLEENGSYLFTIKPDNAWKDSDIPTSTGGFYTTDVARPQRALMIAAIPLKRTFIRPWFRVVTRVGSTGSEENFLDPDRIPAADGTLQEVYRATRSGELFIYVNDAVIGIPGLYSLFYRNNTGTGTITVKRR